MSLRELKRFVVLRVHHSEGGPRIALDSDWADRENAETYVQQKNDAEQMWVCEVMSAFTRKMVREPIVHCVAPGVVEITHPGVEVAK